MRIRLPVLLVPFLLATMLASASAWAQTFPSRTIRIVVPGGTGTSLDVAAREIAQKLQEEWGTPLVVENRAGAGNSIGTEVVARSAPDGYSWLLAPYNSLVVNPHLLKNVGDPLKDFAGITTVAYVPFVVVVHPSIPATSIRELIAAAKAKPGSINYGSTGPGSAQHLGAEQFKFLTGTDLTHVPYKGGPTVIADLLAGRIQLYFGAVNSLLPHIRAGSLRALAFASSKRDSAVADLPTVAESVPDFAMSTWTAMVVPAGVPADIITRIHGGVVGTLNNPEIRGRLARQGIVVDTCAPQELDALVRKEHAMYARLVKATGLKGE